MVEPIVPDAWFADPDVHDARTARARGLTRSGRRWIKFPTGRTTIDEQGRTIPGGKGRFVSIEDYERTLRPALVGSMPAADTAGWSRLDAVRARVCRPRGGPECARLLPRAGSPPDLAQVIDPYREGDGPVVFNFDWSFNHYPRAYERPGPTVGIYRLRAGRCGTKAPDFRSVAWLQGDSGAPSRIGATELLTERDTRHMRRAIELAELGRGHTRPNPLVGAVIARDDQVLGEATMPRTAAITRRWLRWPRVRSTRSGRPCT